MPCYSWDFRNNRIVIPVLVFSTCDRNSLQAEALLDTGATISALAPQIVIQLGLQSLGKRPVKFGGGEELVNRYAFQLAVMPTEAEASPSPFMFDPCDGFGLKQPQSFDLLIGMDIISQFDWEISRHGKVTLTL